MRAAARASGGSLADPRSPASRVPAHNLMRYRPAEVTAAILEAPDGASA